MNREEFLNSIKKVSDTRHHKVSNSYGVYDGYKYYRKNKPKESKYVLSESQYFAIIRKELRKYNPRVFFECNKLKTNLPIDWDRTLKLWYEDEESFRNKTLIKVEEKELFKIYYNKSKANYINKSFYQIQFNRELKKKLKTKIKEGNIEAFTF